MKIWFIQLFLLLVAVIGIGKGFLNDVEFQTIIKERCYNRTLDHKRLVNGQHVPLGNTMETFIDILEDFERNFTHPPEKIIELFLTRFRIDGVIEEQENVFRQNLNDKGRLELIKAILKPTTKLTEFREEIFSEEKKCALYYMMSHAIVIDKESHFNPTVPPDGTSPEATEQGVVTLNNNPIHSIALGRVLLGILAGLKSEQEQSTASILKFINKLPSMPPEPHQLEGKIDPLYGVTVGDTIAAEVLRTVRTEAGKITKTRKFGPNGKWNSTNCPTKYILTKPATYATYGEIRGAGDGLILGLQVRELRKKNAKISISTLLRMYYSTRGIPLSNTYSYCRRWDNWGIYNDKAFEQIRFYSRLMNIAIGGSSLKDADLLEGANDAFSEFTNSRDDIVDSIIRQENCFNYDLDVASSCETPSDVFVVLDTRGNEEDIWKRQKDVVTSLSTGLDIRYYGGRFYIFTNSRGFGDRVLETIAFNETSSGCVGCKLDWYYAGKIKFFNYNYSNCKLNYLLNFMLILNKFHISFINVLMK
ncbi:uncharacterized protein LOC111621260 isoform X1 [Centruroides sculpturatus]|uniref:uncharacterized protein LOC111621260 isoform X1 n=1 Tax=Centruroides sculpturatus TaxID=218467 RepID=UPI000C6CBC4E|nr:uncharacterized protein LOC111621260 isoform X1 [Centruroides sculpturatus]